jgi:tRNA(Ile)-lysidine synthase
MEPLPHDLIARFRADYERLLVAGDASDHRIALAVSGGPDSMGMLALAAAAYPGRIIAATVDHGLRAESAQEAGMVARCCGQLGVPHATLKIEVPPGASGNLHGWARQERYLLLKRWAFAAGTSILCTAHHADDQAETFLMRAARATGLSGLAAVRARNETVVTSAGETRTEIIEDGGAVIHVPYHPIALLRPLLGWRRHELHAIVKSRALPFVEDPSNRDPRFDRTRFRAWLAEAPWLDPIKIGKTAENLAALDADLHEISEWLWQARALESDPFEARFDVTGLPRGVNRYLARMAIDHVQSINGMHGGNWNQASNVESLLDALEAGKAATQANVLASAKGTVWHFREAPPRRSQ